MTIARAVAAAFFLGALAACTPASPPESSGAQAAPTGGSALVGAEWTVEDIGGTGIIDRSKVTINFEDGRVFGAGSCNRFMGGYTVGDGFKIELGQMASTMMACPDALMNQEQKYLALLSEVTSYSIDETGALILKAPDGRTIKARRG